MGAMKTLEIYSHKTDESLGKVVQDDGQLTAEDSVADIVRGQQKRLTRLLGVEPSDSALFDHLATWSNGYIGGRLVTDYL